MLASVSPYLSFNGTCDAAFKFYKSVFGGEFDEIHHYKDIPGQEMPESEKEKILHVSLPLTKHVTLMGADSSELFGQTTQFGNCITITLSPSSAEETIRIYNALSDGGKVSMPLEKTFWADLYTSFTDKFGIGWSINFIEGKEYK